MSAFSWIGLNGRVLAVLLCLATPAAAVGTDTTTPPPGIPVAPLAAGSLAERVVTDLLEGMQDFLAANSGLPLRYSVGDPVTAVEKGNQVTVTFPDFRLTFDNQVEVALGDMVLAVVPRDEGYYDVTGSMPPRMEVRDRNGRHAPIVFLFGENRHSGVWSVDAQAYVKADFSFRDLRAGEKDKPPLLTVDSVVGKQDFTGGTATVWSGPFDIALSGIHVEVPDVAQPPTANNSIDIAELRYAGTIDGLDIEAWRRISWGTHWPVPGTPMPPEEIARLTEAFSTFSWGHVAIDVSLSGLRAREGNLTVFSLEGAGYRFHWDDTRKPGGVGFGMEIEGLDLRQDAVSPEMVPGRVGFDLTVDRFPVRALLAAVIPEILAMDPAKAGEPQAFPVNGDALAALILAAGPRVILDDVVFESDLVEMTAAGNVDSDPEAAQGFVGAIDATITGLDRAMQSLSEKAKTDPEVGEILPLLAMARGFGQAQPGTQGDKTVLGYKIEMGRDGRLTINGAPIDAAPNAQAAPVQRSAVEESFRKGVTLYQAGRHDEAAPVLEEALALGEKEFGPTNPTVAALLDHLAVVYHAQGRYGDAAPLLKRAVAIRRQALGPKHPDVARSFKNLVDLYVAGANAGDAEAQYALAEMHRIGHGIPRDWKKAAHWYRLAAEQGHAVAQSSLGYLYRKGWGVAKDAAAAAGWYLQAAQQGHPQAQYALADMHRLGEGTVKDAAAAVEWYEKAAEQNHADAQNALAFMYRKGLGVARDEALAAKWYRMAAEQGLARAQSGLGFLYENGMGVPTDLAEAARWYEKAAQQGNSYAKKALERLAPEQPKAAP